MDLTALVWHGLVYGALLSVLLSVPVMVSLYVNAEIWVGDYPPDVRAKYGPASARSQRQQRRLAVVLLGLVAGTTVLALWQLAQQNGGRLAFVDAFVSTFVLLMLFNLFDLVVLDWFVLMLLRPRWSILPGTEGMAGYDDVWFPFRGFLRGTVGILVLSLVIAGIAALVAR